MNVITIGFKDGKIEGYSMTIELENIKEDIEDEDEQDIQDY